HHAHTRVGSARIAPPWLSCPPDPPLGRLSPKQSPRYMVFSRMGPNQSIEWGQIRVSKSDEKSGLRRDAVRSQVSTRSRRKGKETGLLIPSDKSASRNVATTNRSPALLIYLWRSHRFGASLTIVHIRHR